MTNATNATNASLVGGMVDGSGAALEAGASQPFVVTPVAVAQTTTTIAAVTVTAAVAGAGATAAVPLAFALQRAVMFSDLAGAPANPTFAEVGKEMQWVQGRFNIANFGGGGGGGGGSAKQRRLNTGGGGGKGAGGASGGKGKQSGSNTQGPSAKQAKEQTLWSMLNGSITDFCIIAAVFVIVHLMVLRGWRRINRWGNRFVRKRRQRRVAKRNAKQSAAKRTEVSSHETALADEASGSSAADQKASPPATTEARKAMDDAIGSAVDPSLIDERMKLRLQQGISAQQSPSAAKLCARDEQMASVSVTLVDPHTSVHPVDQVDQVTLVDPKLAAPDSITPSSPPASPPEPQAAEGRTSTQVQHPIPWDPHPLRGAAQGSCGLTDTDGGEVTVDVWKSTTRAAARSSKYKASKDSMRKSVAVRFRASSVGRSSAAEAPPRKQQPLDFKPLPGVLAWPNLERSLTIFFIAGIVQAAASVLGAYVSDTIESPALVAWAIVIILVCFAWLLVEAWLVRQFHLRYGSPKVADSMWIKAEKVAHRSDVDDPLIALLSRCGCIRPSLRFRGCYEPPEADTEEPDRTERAMKGGPVQSFMFMTHRKKQLPGDIHASMMSSWLADVSAKRGGAHYQYMKAFVQALSGFVVGIGFDAAPDSARAHFQALGAMALQFAFAGWILAGRPAGDRIEGWVTALEAILCGGSIFLLYIGGIAVRAAAAEAGQAADLTSFQNSGLGFSVSAILAPLVLVFYDQLVLPLVAHLTAPPGKGQRKKTICETLYGMVILVPTVLSECCGAGGVAETIVGAATEVEGGLKESAEDVYSTKRIDKDRQDLAGETGSSAREASKERRRITRHKAYMPPKEDAVEYT